MANLGAVRFVKLVHLDGGAREVCDDGCNKQGEPNQQRQHLVAMLRKRTPMPNINEKGEAQGYITDSVGEPLLVNTFRLAAAPRPFPYDRIGEKERNAVREADAGFDRSPPMRNEDGEWSTPSQMWLAHSESWRRWKRKNAEEQDAVVAQAQRLKAGEALENLLIQQTRRDKRTGAPANA